MKVSIVIPCYNERDTIEKIVEALRSGFAAATGDFIVVQDADLEYSPEDYPVLLEPLLSGKADAVLGSRFMGGRPHRVLFFWHMVVNKFLTLLSNMFTNINLTDVETGYNAFKTPLIKSIQIEEDRFGVEPEIIAKLARTGCRIYEVGISYSGRTYAEGKKINWKDGLRAIYAIFKYNLERHPTPNQLRGANLLGEGPTKMKGTSAYD